MDRPGLGWERSKVEDESCVPPAVEEKKTEMLLDHIVHRFLWLFSVKLLNKVYISDVKMAV